MQEIRKKESEWTGLQVPHERRLFDDNKKYFKIKMLNLDQISIFWKKIDYVTVKHLWMSNFMQEIRKSESIGLQVRNERRLFDVTKSASKLKCLLLSIYEWNFSEQKLIMTFLSIYECLTSGKKLEKTNQVLVSRYCMNADYLT